jgi:hypothetical protein
MIGHMWRLWWPDMLQRVEQGCVFYCLGLLLIVLLASAGPTLAASRLSWASPIRADHQPPFVSPATVTGVSCPSMGLCVAVDGVGDVLSSTDPTGGTGAWDKTQMNVGFTDVSCPSVSLCVAVDSNGDVITSTDPTGGSGAWTKTQVVSVSAEDSLEAVSCPSSDLCVITDNLGDALTSTDPTGGAGAWTKTTGVGGAGHGLGGLSCPSVRLCVGVATEGDVVTSTDPTGGTGAWTSTNVDGNHSLLDVSCASESLCVATDNYGNVLTSTEPTGTADAWTPAHVGTGLIEHVSCASRGLCIALDDNEVITSTQPTGGASAWTSTPLEIANEHGGQYRLDSAACPSAELCVLGDSGGAVATSTEPTGGMSAWTVSNLEIGSSGLQGVSCAPAGLCVAVDGAGNVITSSDPAGGASAWSEAHVDNHRLDSVSCPSAGLCVAVDEAGNVVSSTDPTGGAGAWSVSDVDGEHTLYSVSCPSRSLCVATANEGNVVTSTDPTGGAGAWSVTHVGELFLRDLSCPSADLCVAVGSGGNIVTSTEPSTPKASAWRVALVADAPIDGVSCPSVELCIAVDLHDGVLSSIDPAGGTDAWNTTYLLEGLNGLADVSCGTIDLCVATIYGGNGSAGNVTASTDPTGAAAAWSETEIYGGPIHNQEAPFELYVEILTGVSCTRDSCVVIDTAGDVMVGEVQSAPGNSAPPTVSGMPVLGQTLSCSSGSWTGYPPPTFTYQWLRDGAPIDGADTSTYVVQAADQDHGLSCQVTAANNEGSASATSNTLQVPTAQEPGGGGLSGGPSDGDSQGTLTGAVSNAFALTDLESVARHGAIKVTLTLPGPGTLQIVGNASPAQLAGAAHAKKKHRTTLVVAPLRLTVDKAGRTVVTLVPTASAKAILAKHGRLGATITITYTPKGGEPRSIVRTVTFRLKRRR